MNNSWVSSFIMKLGEIFRNFDLCTMHQVRRTSVSTYFFLFPRQVRLNRVLLYIFSEDYLKQSKITITTDGASVMLGIHLESQP